MRLWYYGPANYVVLCRPCARTASQYSPQLAWNGPDPSTARELLSKTTVFIQIIEASPCAQHLPKYDTNVVKLQVNDLQREASESGMPLTITNYFTIVVRKMIEQVLQVFCKVSCWYCIGIMGCMSTKLHGLPKSNALLSERHVGS
ncbi:hypothetical protein COOONC_04890 [Cooperia oncophora]